MHARRGLPSRHQGDLPVGAQCVPDTSGRLERDCRFFLGRGGEGEIGGCGELRRGGSRDRKDLAHALRPRQGRGPGGAFEPRGSLADQAGVRPGTGRVHFEARGVRGHRRRGWGQVRGQKGQEGQLPSNQGRFPADLPFGRRCDVSQYHFVQPLAAISDREQRVLQFLHIQRPRERLQAQHGLEMAWRSVHGDPGRCAIHQERDAERKTPVQFQGQGFR
mmetsp:Transcript_5173/g.15421  ORF Transcript_5173/g.15421 Transcript_5173/m.15421 type:complete len:219 (+) Transcript_5173:1932-2588(+)